ncbi:MAG: CHASE2 domain-containing protein [Elusimicrobia bacterium]|nr:CHASE2 domain-containing protein [Elusimicrobiota bacterium]
MPDSKKEESPVGSRFPLYFSVAFALALSVLQIGGLLDQFDRKWSDEMFRLRGVEKADPRVVVVAIDEATLKYVGRFPIPRRYYRELLNNLFSYGAKVVGLDIMLLEESTAEEDAALIGVTKKWGDRIVHASVLELDRTKELRWLARQPFPALKKVTPRTGFVNQLMIDPDGEVRRSYLVVGKDYNDQSSWQKDPEGSPSFALAILSAFEGKPISAYTNRPNAVLINYRGERKEDDSHEVERGIPRISATRLLAKDLDKKSREQLRSELDGRIVLIGSSAKGWFDFFPSPFASQALGVEVHANVIDNLLNNRELHYAPMLLAVAFILLFSLVSVWTVELPVILGSAITAMLFGGWLAGCYFMFRRLLVLDFFGPCAAVLVPYLFLIIRKTRAEQMEKRFIKQTFGQYVAPEVVDALVRDPSKLRLGGDKRDMTVLFLDIAHFTTISEKMSPEKLIQFLNHYLTALSDVIMANKGVVDKYIGDCVMAFWNAPLDEPRHRVLACLSAVECIEAIERLNKEYVDPTIPEKPAIRVGVNSGDMVVGNTGSARKLAYTVLGDEVNLASRLEGANKFFGSRIMVSEGCYKEAADAVEARELGRVRVVGKAIPIRVYELLSKKGQLKDSWREALPVYTKGVEAFQKGVELARRKDADASTKSFADARDHFAAVLKIIPGDGPSTLYKNQAEDYSQIPPIDWDGVFNLSAK